MDKKTTNNNYYNKAFDSLYYILSNPNTNINNDTQLKIENSLNNLCRSFNLDKNSENKNSLGISLDSLSKDLQDLLTTANGELKVSIKKYKAVLRENIKKRDRILKPKEKKQVTVNPIKKISKKDKVVIKKKAEVVLKRKGQIEKNSQNEVYIYNVYELLRCRDLVSIILSHYLRWVCYNETNEVTYQYLLNISTKLGENIFNLYLYTLYTKYKDESKSDLSFSS